MKQSAMFIFHQTRMNPIKNIYISPFPHFIIFPPQKNRPLRKAHCSSIPSPVTLVRGPRAAPAFPSDSRYLGSRGAGMGTSAPRGPCHAAIPSALALPQNGHCPSRSLTTAPRAVPVSLATSSYQRSTRFLGKKRKMKKILGGITAVRSRRASIPTMAPASGNPSQGDRAG